MNDFVYLLKRCISSIMSNTKKRIEKSIMRRGISPRRLATAGKMAETCWQR